MTEFYLKNGFDLGKIYEPSCLSIYLPGLDIILNSRNKKVRGLHSSLLKSSAAKNYIKYVDGVLEEELEKYNPNAVIIVGDPGRVKDRKNARGFLLAGGKPFKNNYKMKNPEKPYLLAPLMLYIHGFPVGEDMNAGVPSGIFTKSFKAGNKKRVIPSYGIRETGYQRMRGTDFEKEMLKELKSLGYLQ